MKVSCRQIYFCPPFLNFNYKDNPFVRILRASERIELVTTNSLNQYTNNQIRFLSLKILTEKYSTFLISQPKYYFSKTPS